MQSTSPPAPVSGARTVAALVRAYGRVLRNRLWRGSTSQRLTRLVGLLAAAGFWCALFFGTRASAALFVAHFPFAPSVLGKALELLFLVLLGTVAYSSVLVALVHVYLSPDVRLLAILPASSSAVFVAKWVEVAVVSCWAPATFGLALLWGLGAALPITPGYFFAVPPVLIAIIVLPPSLAMAITAVAVNVFPANRTRDALVFLSMVLLLGIFVAVRSLDLEKVLEPAVLAQLSTQVVSLELPAGTLLPSTWAGRLLASYFVPTTTAGWGEVAALAGVCVAAVGLAWLTFVLLFRRGLSISLTARGRWMGAQSLSARLIRMATAPLPRSLGAIARKDLLQFGRDPSQWSQVLLLAALVLIYMLNLRAFPLQQVGVLGLTPQQASDILGFVNIAFVGFVLTAVSLRFLFAAVSLEGRAAWALLTSPVSPRGVLWAKLLPGGVLLLVFGAILVGGSNLILRPGWVVQLGSGLATLLITGSLAGLGVGLGAVMPNYNATSAARIATSLGGLLHMLLGLGIVLAQALLLAGPTFVLWCEVEGKPLGPFAWIGAGVSVAMALAMAMLAVVISTRLGERALSEGLK